MFPSYRNQSVEFQRKSADWFLYDEDIGRYKGLTIFWKTLHLCFTGLSLWNLILQYLKLSSCTIHHTHVNIKFLSRKYTQVVGQKDINCVLIP